MWVGGRSLWSVSGLILHQFVVSSFLRRATLFLHLTDWPSERSASSGVCVPQGKSQTAPLPGREVVMIIRAADGKVTSLQTVDPSELLRSCCTSTLPPRQWLTDKSHWVGRPKILTFCLVLRHFLIPNLESHTVP